MGEFEIVLHALFSNGFRLDQWPMIKFVWQNVFADGSQSENFNIRLLKKYKIREK